MDKTDLLKVMQVALNGPHEHVPDALPEAVRYCVDMGWVTSIEAAHNNSPSCGEYIISGITPAGREFLKFLQTGSPFPSR